MLRVGALGGALDRLGSQIASAVCSGPRKDAGLLKKKSTQ